MDLYPPLILIWLPAPSSPSLMLRRIVEVPGLMAFISMSCNIADGEVFWVDYKLRYNIWNF